MAIKIRERRRTVQDRPGKKPAPGKRRLNGLMAFAIVLSILFWAAVIWWLVRILT